MLLVVLIAAIAKPVPPNWHIIMPIIALITTILLLERIVRHIDHIVSYTNETNIKPVPNPGLTFIILSISLFSSVSSLLIYFP
jgi:hypothetical protein